MDKIKVLKENKHLQALAVIVTGSLNFQKINYPGQNPFTSIGPGLTEDYDHPFREIRLNCNP